MYAKIKELADEAIKLQNKDRMDAVLRTIRGMCSAELVDVAHAQNMAVMKNLEQTSGGLLRKLERPADAEVTENSKVLNEPKEPAKKAAKK